MIVFTFKIVTVLVSLGCCNKYHGLGGSNNRFFFLPFCRMGSAKSDVGRFSSWWGSLPGLQTATLLSFHWEEREWALGSSSSYKDTNPIMGTPPSWPHLNPGTSQRPHLQTLSHWGLGHTSLEETPSVPSTTWAHMSTFLGTGPEHPKLHLLTGVQE